MKKLILSLAALAFATFLFSQDDANDAPEVKQDSVVIIKDGLQNDTKLAF
ncbi:hypothetical protein LX77_03778 [Gelidibacter algens]|jgi:hypothetical protein|uniref:Uncharacterized protein n=1 Tax=Gelidibacter algens TaxID=49280 RepID=A0A327RQK1_9FLAO|nr:hypothetical protein [Gelidibacter algens]RAJ18675.1 hypothetical protein LX77_03778 [Gelidibacter algens]